MLSMTIPLPSMMKEPYRGHLKVPAVLEDTDFKLAVLAVPTSDDIAGDVEKKVASIIKKVQPHSTIELFLFGQSHLSRIHTFLDEPGAK